MAIRKFDATRESPLGARSYSGWNAFLGSHLVEAVQARGHEVTLFNFGNHRGNAPSYVEQIHGSREVDLARLGRRHWDAVIDTCGFLPAQLETSTRYLREHVGQYLFVSSISALDLSQPEVSESSATLPMPESASRSVMTPETYGPLKALCEDVVVRSFRPRALIVRPGLIVGPYDPTDRFTYWPVRIARGGAVLAPVGPDYFVQFVDARDLANWVVLQIECATHGIFNLTGQPNESRGPSHQWTAGLLREREVSLLAACPPTG